MLLIVLLSLVVLLAFHPSVLKPDLNLPLREIKVSSQFPSLLLGHVRVEQEFLLQLQRLEFGVWLPLLAHAHVTGPMVQWIAQAGWRKEET